MGMGLVKEIMVWRFKISHFIVLINKMSDLVAYRPAGTGRSRISRAGVIGIVIGAVVFLAIIIIVIILIQRLNAASSSSNNNGGTPTPVTGTCTSDADCSVKCNLVTGTCTQCVDDSTCSIDRPICLTSSGLCAQCVDNAGCPSGATCSNNTCCDSDDPVLDSLAYTDAGSNSYITVKYTIKQPASTSRVFIVFEDPATGAPIGPVGRSCDSKKKCGQFAACGGPEYICLGGSCKINQCIEYNAAATGETIVYRQATGMTFYGGVSYRVKIRVGYNCGALFNQLTAYSNSLIITIPICDNPPIDPVPPVLFGPVDGTQIDPAYTGVIIALDIPAAEDNFQVVAYVSSQQNANVNTATIINLTTTSYPAEDCKVLFLPYPPAYGIYYIRLQPSERSYCNGLFTPDLAFNYADPNV